MMKYINKKTIILIILLILAIICIIVLPRLDKYEEYIILDDYNLVLKDKTISLAKDKDVIDRSFRIVYDDKYIGNYTLKSIDEKYGNMYHDEDDKEVIIKKPLLGLSGNIGYYAFDVEHMNQEDFMIYKKLINGTVDYSLNDLSIANKITLKDKDGKSTGVKICSVIYEGSDPSEDHSMIFAYDKNKEYLLDEDIPVEDNNEYLLTRFEPMYILDIRNDEKLELVVAKSYYDSLRYSIYQLHNNYAELFYTEG